MYYEKVFRELNARGVRYIVTGGIAVNLHGVPRATADLDIILFLERSNFSRLTGAMEKLGYKPRAPVKFTDITLENLEKWVRKKRMKAFSFKNPKVPYEEVDIVLDHPLDFEQAYKRVEVIKAGDVSIPLISIDDLIASKKHSGRLQDMSDVEALRKVKKIKRGV
jgi:predicted nucleotidyltransferase